MACYYSFLYNLRMIFPIIQKNILAIITSTFLFYPNSVFTVFTSVVVAFWAGT